MHRTLIAIAGSLALAATLVIGATATGALQLASNGQRNGRTHGQVATASNSGRAGSTTADPTDTHGTLHFGPFASSSPDSGTCGNNWANDTFDRFFTVVTNSDGTFRVVEEFKDANFVTVAGASPGACENGPNNLGMVTTGITGRFQGYFVISVTGGSLNRSALCTADLTSCGTTAGFISTVFGTTNFNVTTFLFNYSSRDQQLISHHWKNASADRGGNLGDIRTS